MPGGVPPLPPTDPGRYGPTLDALPLLAWVAAPDGAMEYLNRRCLEYSGLPLDDLLGWDWGWVVHPADLPDSLVQWNECLRTGTPFVMDQRLRRADGQFRWFAARAVPLRDEDGAIVRWFGTNTDVDEARRVESGLRSNRVLFRAFVERNDDGFVLVNADWVIRYANPGVGRLLGHMPEVLVGTDARDWIHPDDRAGLTSPLDFLRIAPTGRVEATARFRHRDTSYRRLGVRATNLLPDPDVRGVAVMLHELAGETPAPPSEFAPG